MQKAKILIVEDNWIVAEDIKVSLQKLGFTVSGMVAYGEEVLDKVRECRPDLVLMDIMLRGEMNGTEAAAQIQTQLNIPVVYLTAYTDENVLDRAKTTEPYGYVVKPFEDRELKTAIEIALYKHKMETKLRQREAWLSTTLMSIGDAVITTDTSGFVTFLNPVAQSLTGWDGDTAIGQRLTDVFNIINEETREQVENPVNKVIRKGKIVGMANHTILIAKDGKETPIDDSAAPIKDEQGNATGIVLVFHDISERKQAHTKLRESEQKFKLVTETIKDVFWMSTCGVGKMIYISPAYENIWERSRENLFQSPQSFLEAIHAGDLDGYLGVMDTYHKKGRPYEIEYRITRKNGEVVWIHEKGYPVSQLVHGSQLMAGVCADITERKQAEERLRDTTHILSEAQKLAHVGSWDWNVQTNEIIWSNEVYHIFGRNPGRFQPRIDSVMNSFHPDDRSKHKELLETSLTNKESYSFETRIVRPDGDVRVVVSTARGIYDNEEKLIRILGTVHDITDRTQAEEEKRRALEFAAEHSRHALVGQVAGKMAHDFNNVLMGIMANAQLAIMDCEDERINVQLEHINAFALRGRDITRNLMAYSKDQEPKQTYFKIQDKIELVLKMLEKDLEGIEVSRNYKPGLSELLGDPGMIQDALVNIIQNSIHAMSKVENPILSVIAYSKDDTIYIDIEDNGCGIPKEHQDSIYTPSFTLKGGQDKTGSYKSGINGTGYGMSNAKKYIVEKHKGDLSLESEFGKGTRITIALKIIKDCLSVDEKKEFSKKQIYGKKRILLVEDETAIADVQYQILSKEPFNHIVSIAANGQMAVDIFDRNKFDIVSLDYMLPGKINGLDVYKHIRDKDKDIPVMFISGNIEFLESMKTLKEKDPKIDHLSKPIDNLSYVDKINELVGMIET